LVANRNNIFLLSLIEKKYTKKERKRRKKEKEEKEEE